MKTVRYVLLGLACYLAFLIVTLPANAVYGYWKNWLGAEVPLVLEGIDGSIWSGSAAQALISDQKVQKLKWQFRPIKLLMGKAELALDFSLQEGYGKGNLGKSLFGGIYLHDVEAWLPMMEFLTFFNMQSLKPGGALAINLNELQIQDRTIASAIGSLVWQDAEVTILKPMPLGSLQVELQPDDDGIKGVLSDQGGPLQAEGLFTLNSEGKYDFNAALAVRDSQQKDLQNAIRSLGRSDRDGKVKLTHSGDIAALRLF
ncbi:type II secretion system protein N [Kaarinaea lacus]